jgi:probable phosphoglycerate mutase
MQLYLIRHADPDYHNKTITPAGHLEAQALAKRLAAQGVDRIYCSPMGRARDTMQYTVDLLNLPYAIEAWMQEIPNWRINLKAWPPFAAWNMPGEVVRAQVPYPARDTWTSYAPLHEPRFATYFEHIRQSSDEFLARHGYERQAGRYRTVTPSQEKIAIFCHHGFGLTWLAHLLELPLPLVWSGFWLPPSSVTTILFEERPVVPINWWVSLKHIFRLKTLKSFIKRRMKIGRQQFVELANRPPPPNFLGRSEDGTRWAVPRCLGLGNVSHLYAAGLPVQPRGLIGNIK